MSAFIVAPEAEDDIFGIWRYLAGQVNAEFANRIEQELIDAFATLAAIPGKGHRRPDLTHADVLFFTLYRYMIVYRRRLPLEILAVLHANRDIESLLNHRI